MSDSDFPLVSVVLPTHNRQLLVGRAIRSVLAQSYPHFELLVVNDASTDHTHDVVSAIVDPRIRYIELKKNLRAAGARNVAIDQASGQFLAFQDDDDVWLVDKLKRQIEFVQSQSGSPGLNLCGHISHRPEGTVRVGGPRYFDQVQPQRGLCPKALIATPGWLVPTELVRKAGMFDPRVRSWDDWELSLRLSEICEFSHLDEPLFMQDRVTGGGMWKDEPVYANDMKIVLERHANKWRDDRRTMAYHYYYIGRLTAANESVTEGRRWLLKAARINPQSIRPWVVYASTFFGSGFVRWVSGASRHLRSWVSRR